MLQILLFLHVAAVAMLFSGIVLEIAGFARLHRAQTIAQVRAAALNFPVVGPLMGLGALLLIAAGIAMVYVGGFGWTPPWIGVTFILTIILAVNGPITNGRRSDAIHELAAKGGDGPITAELQSARSDWFLNYSIVLTVCELLAALFMMTTKPGLTGCIASVIAGAVVPFIVIPVLFGRRTGAIAR